MKGEIMIFNEAGFLEIAIFRSNPSKVGSASSLLGLNSSRRGLIQFKNSDFRNRINNKSVCEL
jgi:hypothetical protein